MPRLVIRVASKSPGSLPGAKIWEKVMANASHFAMYGFLIAMPVTGVGMGYYGKGELPFFFTNIPGAAKENRDGEFDL